MEKDEFSRKVDLVLQTPIPTEDVDEKPLEHDAIFLDKDATPDEVKKFLEEE